jgi:hypothetical protein
MYSRINNLDFCVCEVVVPLFAEKEFDADVKIFANSPAMKKKD